MLPLQQTARWPGTHVELRELTAVVERHCSCPSKSTDMPRATCAAHRMLWQDQRALNGLVFERRIMDRLKREEFSASSVLVDSVGTAVRGDNVGRGKPPSRVSPVLAGVVLVAMGFGMLCAENAWLLVDVYPRTSVVAAWMCLGLLLMVCGAVLIGLAHVNGLFEPRSDAVPIVPSATGLDAVEGCGLRKQARVPGAPPYSSR